MQLYWKFADSAEKIFPGKDFVLYPPKHPNHWWWWLLLVLAVILLAAGFRYRRPK